jgi:DNA-binding MarR family transcriptional regulator
MTNPQNHIAFLMADASRLFRRIFDEQARRLGVTGQQWRVLAALARHPGAKQNVVADILEVEPITLSRMVDRLAKSGMVERRADPADRRAWCLHLTGPAIPLIEEMRLMSHDITARALSQFNAEEEAQLLHLVSRFRENLLDTPTMSAAAVSAEAKEVQHVDAR